MSPRATVESLMDTARDTDVKGCLTRFRESPKLILLIVFVALFLDNMLLTTVVPIMPTFLYQLEHPEDFLPLNLTKANHSRTRSTSYPCEKNGNESRYDFSNNTHKSVDIKETIFGSYVPLGSKGHHYSKNCMNFTTEMDNATENIDQVELRRKNRHANLMHENVEVGLMLASKAFVQLLANPFIGPLTNRIGFSVPLFCGFVIMFISTVIFAFGKTFWVLLIARSVQGIGSACSSVAGMGYLAQVYPDDESRGTAMGIALGGLALGVLVGPPFGGVMYQFVGKEAPFLILAGLAVFDGILQLYALKPSMKAEPEKGASLKTLLSDPYILAAAGSITFANMGIAMLEPSLPIWMIDTMDAPKWQQGMAFFPASLSYMIGTNIFGPLAYKIGRWRSALIGMLLIGICLFSISFCYEFIHILWPIAGIGWGIGMVDSSMMPHMAYLVDIRHVSVYGSVYAIADIAFCLGFAIGPAISGTIVRAIGFSWMLWIISFVNLLYAPLMYLLRNPTPKEEKLSLISNDENTMNYVTYNHTTENDEMTTYSHADTNGQATLTTNGKSNTYYTTNSQAPTYEDEY